MAYSMLTVFVNGHCNLMLLANGYYCECWSITYLVPTMYTNAFYFLLFTLMKLCSIALTAYVYL